MVAAGALMLLTATLVVGRPSVFTDTDDYYAQGRSIVRAFEKLAQKGVPIVNWDDVRYRAAHPDAGDQEPVHNQDGARSAYYGLALYLLQSVGTLWLLAAVQALLAAALVFALLRAALGAFAPKVYAGTMGALAVASTLPAFTSFAMPDVFAGFAALATVLLMVYPDRFRWPAQLALWAVLAAAMNFHLSNVITSMGLLAASLLALVWFRARALDLLKRGATVVLAAVVAVAGSALYGEMVKLRSGDDLGRPPFLIARVLADGPGRTFLAKSCRTDAPFRLCAFKWLPLDDSEDILWSDDPSRGIFNMSDFATREALEKEDVKFALASTLADPLGQAQASLDNWRQQIFNIRLDEPLQSPGYYLHDSYWRTTNLPRLIRGAAPWCAERGAKCAAAVDPEILAVADGVLAFAAAAYVLWRLAASGALKTWGAKRFSSPTVRASLAAVLLLTAVIVNAGVCGAISGPFPRYQARIVWLFPMAALLIEAVLRSEGFAPAWPFRRRPRLKAVPL
jgi:hypothetical protein